MTGNLHHQVAVITGGRVALQAAAGAPETAKGSGSAGHIVGVLSLAVFMSSLDLFVVNLAFPNIARDYPGASLGSLSWVLNGYTIVFASVLIPAGRYADRIGRRRTFVTGLLVFSVGSVACGSTFGVESLIGARVLQGLGAGLMVPASLSVLLASVPLDKRAKAIGTWAAFGGLGGAVAPVVGGLLVQAGWRWIFWINVPVGLIAGLIAARILPESRDEEQHARPDLVGVIVLASSVGLLALGLVQAHTWGWGTGRFDAALAGAVVGGAVVLARSRSHPAPVIELGLLRLRSFAGSFIASILYYAAFGAILLNFVEFLTSVWHYSPLRAGLALAPAPVLMLAFARLVAPRLMTRLGGPAPVAVLGITLSLGMQLLWLATMQAQPAYVTHLLPVQLLGGAGVGLTTPSLLAAGTAPLPPARFGTGSGVLNMARQMGITIGVAALVAILSMVDRGAPIPAFRSGIWLAIAFFVAANVIATVILVGLPRQRQVPSPSAAVTGPSIIEPERLGLRSVLEEDRLE